MRKNLLRKLINSGKPTTNYFSTKWIQPTGHDTKIQIYSHIERQKVPLIIKNPNYITWYTCGPTVYDSAHIGHASCYMRLDILQRILRNYFKYNIVSLMNITDIDDKIIKRSLELDKSPKEISKHYEDEFWQDMNALGIRKPNKILRVTENINLIVDFIEKLILEGFAYKGSDESIYFDVNKYLETNIYGKLHKYSNSDVKKTTVKKNDADFALWKVSKENEPYWESKFGPGRPGWHIECSTLAGHYLGSTIDIHCGGVDLRFPHHENEEAQSCAFFHVQQWVNYWVHTGHLHLPDSVKMSKSLKNTLSISSLLEKCTPVVFRMVCLLSTYRNHMEYTEDLLLNAETQVKGLKNFLDACEMHLNQGIAFEAEDLIEKFHQTVNEVDLHLRDDFDTSSCLKSINQLINITNRCLNSGKTKGRDQSAIIIAIVNYIEEILGHVFGLDLFQNKSSVNSSNTRSEEDFNTAMDLLVSFRHQLRARALISKDRELLSLCDDVRAECVEKLGVSLKDHAKISTWVK